MNETHGGSDSGIKGKIKPRRKLTRRLPPEKWAEVKSFVCSGRPMPEVAEAFGISTSAINARSVDEQWPTPTRLKRKKDALTREAEKVKTASEKGNSGQKTPTDANNLQEGVDSALSDPSQELSRLATDLLQVVRESPERFDQCAGDFAQAMVAAGLAQVPAPRTISELTKWETLRRQFKGLDSKNAGAGGLFDPPPPVRRATGKVVEAETPPPGDPMAGFEV